MNDWRTEPVTEKQREIMESIQVDSDGIIPRFTGSTKGEASDYIDKWLKMSHHCRVIGDEYMDS